ncbi:hypothetical protein [uncultured Algibacter sp.]|uniref:hypothetical protein n=1 Tax=uncultured Algibacter sp. TaxID=298659 RepID=UPI002615321E|nr:hypothetical protein [uncultured Algibacter sp.]
MMLKELTGQYYITGTNQNAELTTYKGILDLIVDENNRVRAKWLINETQEQFGYGFFKDNILVINFNYKNDNIIFKGVVVYKCISKDLLEGFWSEKHADPNYIGEEHCFRLNKLKETIN